MSAFIAPFFCSIVARRSSSLRMCSTASSSPKANREVVAHTARLAHLQLSDEEIERIVPDFDKMLRFVDSMNEISDDSPSENDNSSGDAEKRPVSGEQLRPDQPFSFPYV